MSRTFLSSSLTFSWSPWNSWRKEAWVPVVPCKHEAAGRRIGCSAPNICSELLLADFQIRLRHQKSRNAPLPLLDAPGPTERLALSITCFCIRSRPTPLYLDSLNLSAALASERLASSITSYYIQRTPFPLTLAPLNLSAVHSL